MPSNLLSYGVKKKKSRRQREQLQDMNAARWCTVKENHPPTVTTSTSSRRQKEPSLKTLDSRIITLSAHLKTEALLNDTQNLLSKAEMQADVADRNANTERARADEYQKKFYNANRKAVRATKTREQAKKDLANLKCEHKASEAEVTQTMKVMRKQAECTDAQFKSEIAYLENQANKLTRIIRQIHTENCQLKLDVRYVPEHIRKQVTKALAKARCIQLKDKNAYTPEARALMMELRKLGVPATAIKGTFQAFAASWEVEIDCAPDARTVGRVDDESYIAGRIQMIEETIDAGGK